MAQPANFVDLQNGFYNAFSQGLGFSPSDPFQVVQPSPPLSGGTEGDTLLWNYFNNLPPLSLTHNTLLSGGNQFLSNYQAVMSALLAAEDTFQSTIGPECYALYQQAVETNQVKSGDPRAFATWARMVTPCSANAMKGASALAASMLDPVFAAQMNVLPYKPAGTDSVTFVPGYATMLAQLLTAPSRDFSVAASNWNWDVKSTWAKGSDSGFFGLWGGSSSTSTLSQKFASGGVTINASFGNVLQFSATPGDWYTSSAFGLAYSSKTGAPWDPAKPINWENTFGPQGNMQRYATAYLIGNDMDVTVLSAATYSDQEQTEIQRNSGAGMWPFYAKKESSGASTDVGFTATGNMSVSFKSNRGVPIVLGCIVLPVSEYLGHSSEASAILMKKMAY